MTIPNDMRHILALALQDACRLAGCGGEEEIHDAYMAALEWLRAQPDAPAMPEPDWSQAPEWAQWWAAHPSSYCAWYAEEPLVCITGTWRRAANTKMGDAGKVEIPLGIDWRTTLTKRPEANNA